MIQHGAAPFLECSSKGEKRLSAFYARIRARGNRSIEDLYQGAKIFDDGAGGTRTGLSWREAKGKRALNADEVRALYGRLWDEYLAENPDLMPMITAASGVADLFGTPGSACQATEIWRIRCQALGLDPVAADAAAKSAPAKKPTQPAPQAAEPTRPRRSTSILDFF